MLSCSRIVTILYIINCCHGVHTNMRGIVRFTLSIDKMYSVLNTYINCYIETLMEVLCALEDTRWHN